MKHGFWNKNVSDREFLDCSSVRETNQLQSDQGMTTSYQVSARSRAGSIQCGECDKPQNNIGIKLDNIGTIVTHSNHIGIKLDNIGTIVTHSNHIGIKLDNIGMIVTHSNHIGIKLDNIGTIVTH